VSSASSAAAPTFTVVLDGVPAHGIAVDEHVVLRVGPDITLIPVAPAAGEALVSKTRQVK
jgi:hypothetical protein